MENANTVSPRQIGFLTMWSRFLSPKTCSSTVLLEGKVAIRSFHFDNFKISRKLDIRYPLKMGLAEIIYLHHVGHTFIDHVHALCLYGTSANFCSLCSSEPTGKMAIYYPFIVLGLAWKTQMQSLQDKLDF